MIFYVSGETKQVLTAQPDMTGKALVEVAIPDGMPLRFLLQQLQSLMASISGNDAAINALVLKITYGS